MRKEYSGAFFERLILLGICAALPVILCRGTVLADASYRIKLDSGMKQAVFALSYTGEVESLKILSPTGVSYDSETCGAAYRKDNGKIRIGISYAEPGLWQIILTGSPDDGFRLLITSDPDYGEYAGTGISKVPETNPSEVPETVPSEAPAAGSSETFKPGAAEATAAIESSASGPESTIPMAVTEQTGSTPETAAAAVKIGSETVAVQTEAAPSTAAGDVHPAPSAYTDAATDSAGDSLSGSAIFPTAEPDEGYSGTESITASASYVGNGSDNPVEIRTEERIQEREARVLCLAFAVTLAAIILSAGKIIKGAPDRAPRSHLNRMKTKEEKVDFRDYFPEEK